MPGVSIETIQTSLHHSTYQQQALAKDASPPIEHKGYSLQNYFIHVVFT